jgi:hypothetical protein
VPSEERVFESVDNSPEAKAANKAYFDAQGITHEVVDDAAAGDGAKPPAGETKPSETAAPIPGSEPEDTVVDAETAADWESAKTDVKRQSRYAKERQEKRELKAANEKMARELAELKAKQNAPAGEPKPDEPKPGSTAPAPAGDKPAAAADANAAPTFTEAEPAEPKYEDFANEDDQFAAYQTAVTKHSKEWNRWDRRREKFEEQAAADKVRSTEQAQTAQNARITQLQADLAEIRKELPDFDEVVKNGNVFTMALSGVSTSVPGGLKAAYQLAKDPVKLKDFNDRTSETQIVNGKPVPTQRAWDLALYLLGQVGVPLTPTPSSAPAGSPPAANTPSSQPREERAAPAPARGRASEEPRREDLAGDARRDRLAKELFV